MNNSNIASIIESRRGTWTVEALAEALGRKPSHLYKLIRTGSLPAYKLCGCLVLDPIETADWWRKQRTT